MTVLYAQGATSITNDNNRELPAMHIMRLQCSRKKGTTWRLTPRPQSPAGAGPADVTQQDGAAPKREKRIPEYLEADEINAIIRAAPSPKAKLLMLQQWRAGLRVSEALDLEVRDLSLDAASPTLRVRSGKGGKTRLVPVHPELHAALRQRTGLTGTSATADL